MDRRGRRPVISSFVDWIGYTAATLTTIAFMPQAWQTWRTRDVQAISLGMYSLFTSGIALWLVYGWLLGAWPIVAANAITLLLALGILAMKWRWGREGADR
jgi:MtN3 and saliva related transmembrane protein